MNVEKIFSNKLKSVLENENNFIDFLNNCTKHHKHNLVNQIMLNGEKSEIVATKEQWKKIGGDIVDINKNIKSFKILGNSKLKEIELYDISNVNNIKDEDLLSWELSDIELLELNRQLKIYDFEKYIKDIAEKETKNYIYNDCIIEFVKYITCKK